MFAKDSHICKSKGTEKRWQKENNRSLKKKRLLEVDLPSYNRDRPFFGHSGVLETVSPTLHSVLPLATWTMVEIEQVIKSSTKL